MDRHVWVNSIFSTLLGRLRAAKNQQRLQALICGDAVIGPWLLNQVILASSFRNLLPEVSFAVPITVHIGQQKGTHLLTQDQFMGMLLYVNYAAKQPVEFLLAGTPLHFTPEDLHKLYNTGVYIITMLGGDEFSFYRPEFMQGFITMARWLGANYRAGYRDIRERQHREACVVS
jgi:hypothetical protein